MKVGVSPQLPRGLCQLSKNNLWGDARPELPELQKLTEEGNLQARHRYPLQPGLQIPRAKGAPDLTAI